MIDSKFAIEQLNRMAGLNFFPVPKKGDTLAAAAFKELRLALECAATDSIGKLVVDEWLKTSADAPKPAELRGAAYVENERLERQESTKYKPPPPRHAHCYQCQDFGIVESIDAGNIRSISCYCDCSAGRERLQHAHGAEERCKPPQNPCPECVNAARKKLIAFENRNRIKPKRPEEMRHVGEVYHGDF